jgi:hypothetical protein
MKRLTTNEHQWTLIKINQIRVYSCLPSRNLVKAGALVVRNLYG